MEKITLKNGLTVTNAVLGAMNFGTSISKENAYAVLDAYVAAGGNFIDTSNNYAHWLGTGDESETLLGEWLKERGNRQELVIATKVGFDRHGEGAGLKKEQIEYWVDESLRKLGTDYIDLYYAHTDDPSTELCETMAAFDSLVKAGKVRALGGSNYDTWRFAEANLQGYTPYTVMQQKLTYLKHKFSAAPAYAFNESTDRERLRYLYSKDIPLVAYACLAKGGYEKPERMPTEYETGARLEAISQMASEKGVCTSALVIAYLCNLHRINGMPRVLPLFSSSNTKNFLASLEGASLTLTDEELNTLYNA